MSRQRLLRCAVLLAAGFSIIHAPAQEKFIRLRNETIATPPLAARAQTTAAVAGTEPALSGLFLVQFHERFQPAWREELRALGVELLRYVPDDAFVARFNNAPASRVKALPSVRWVGEFRPEHKIHPRVRQWQAGPVAGEARSLNVLLSPSATSPEVLAVRRLLPRPERESRSRFGALLQARALPADVAALAQSPAVLWIEPAFKPKLNDEIASRIVGGEGPGHQTFTQSLGYDGSGVVVAVADSGLHNGDAETMHPDLAGRVDAFFFYGNLDDAADEHSHGTHVTGIIAGDGALGETDELGYLYGLGVAPRAHIVAQRLFDGAGGYEAPPSFETLTRDATRAGAVIGSNSWGDDTQGGYDLSAMEFDALVRDADALTDGDQQYILEFSAGNAGPGAQTIGSPAVAKNVIATGAAQNNRPEFFIYGDGPDVMADFSSRGPCEDGRIKPDLTAPGTWIASLQSASATDENAWAAVSPYYQYQGGTSQAGPHVSGAAAVFVQYYRERHGGQTPSPALVKAALINSATDMDDTVETEPAPNMDEGWGRVDLANLIEAPRTYEFLDQTALLITGQTYERHVVIASDAEPFKVTLAYTDVPGFPAAIPALVNDLDLEIIAPDGSVYRGNQFLDGGSVPHAPAADAINNVEGVRLFAPRPGEYVVRVRARNVAQDARYDTVAVDQDFALVVSGDVPPTGAGFVFFDRHFYTAPDAIKVTVFDTDLAGQPSVNLNVRSATQPSGVNLLLRAAAAAGSFTGAVGTVTAPTAGKLRLAHGDAITADYFDASSALTNTASALADLLPPVITAVAATNELGRTVVTWQTDEPANSIVRFSTNTSLSLSATNTELALDHAVALDDLIPRRTYRFAVISQDEAGNRATNDDSGMLYNFTVIGAPTLLLVDNYQSDGFGFGPDIPLSTYTTALDQLGVAYSVLDLTAGGDSPDFNTLRPFRVVIWRVSDNVFINNTLSAAEQTAVQQYVQGGGSFFMASMEQLTRVPAAFRQGVLQVSASTEPGVPVATGVPGNPITAGLNLALDYAPWETENYELFGVPADISDTMTLTTNAAPILNSAGGGVAGLMYPKPGLDRAGRVVFLSFPLEAVPDTAPAPHNRATLLRNILNFLAPGEQGVGAVTFDNTAYTIPSRATIEVADSDLAGLGQVSASVISTTDPAGRTVTLAETVRRGVFRGSVTLVATNSSTPLDALRVRDGDQVVASYFDASAGRSVTATSRVETVSPVILNVDAEPDYTAALISWDTSELADSLVQFGESAFLGRTAFSADFTDLHEVQLEGLAPDRLYYYRIVSRDAAGNAAVDDNFGDLYTFTTLRPIRPPWLDTLEAGGTNWVVFDGEDTQATWTLGTPNNSLDTAAHSPTRAWGTALNGGAIDLADTFLISPAIDLTGGNSATLRFWHQYDFTVESEFDIIVGGELLIITNNQIATLETYFDSFIGWDEEEIDLTPFLGQVAYLVWHYQVFSFETAPRAGWLLDDVSVEVATIAPGVITVTNTLAQARFALGGPSTRNGGGWLTTITNARPGDYVVTFSTVPFYSTPPPQTNTLATGGSLVFRGNYAFADANANAISDAFELAAFGAVSPERTRFTDTDGDGATDYEEFLAGTNPNSASAKLQLAIPVIQGDGSLRLDWPSLSGRAYRVWQSEDLVSWTPASDWIFANFNTTSLRLTDWNANHSLMFKVEVRP